MNDYIDELNAQIVDDDEIQAQFIDSDDIISADIDNSVKVGIYTGINNDLIDVEIDNTNQTIEAKSKTYVFEQGIAASTWVIEHNLNKYPSVTVIDSAGDQVFANLNYIDENELVLDFGAEFTGKAYLN